MRGTKAKMIRAQEQAVKDFVFGLQGHVVATPADDGTIHVTLGRNKELVFNITVPVVLQAAQKAAFIVERMKEQMIAEMTSVR